MARKHVAASLLLEGYSPSQIAEKMGITLNSVMGYLYSQVGEGRIRRSDILFSLDEEVRQIAEAEIARKGTTVYARLIQGIRRRVECDPEDIRIYLSLRDSRASLGDMYEFIRDIEVTLHRLIRDVLVAAYGARWWWDGIPVQTRKECVAIREEDPDPSDPYCYTTLGQLAGIIDKQWGLFAKALPKRVAQHRGKLIARLRQLNQIRNRVMHPVRYSNPTEDDFAFVRQLAFDLEQSKWKLPDARPVG
jgi:predicted transcriptional regulator